MTARDGGSDRPDEPRPHDPPADGRGVDDGHSVHSVHSVHGVHGGPGVQGVHEMPGVSAPSGGAEAAPPPRRPLASRRSLVAFGALLLVMAVIVAGGLIHPRYVILRAGPIYDTLGRASDGKDLIGVQGATTYPTTGTLDFTTVAQYGGPGYPIDAWDLLFAKFDGDAEVLDYESVYPPNVTQADVKAETNAQMVGSQHTAVAAALRALGHREEAKIEQVAPAGPARLTLRAGDVVLAVAGHRITRSAQVGEYVQQAPKADAVPVTVRRDGREVTVDVPTTTAQGRRYLGVGISPTFPGAPKVTIDAGDVGGPSAGTMFSLAVYDKLTPGALTGGAKIAGTGTMGLDDQVGPIGGIRHKLVGAADGGAAWFLAPAANCTEVVGHVPQGLHVVKVATFAQAKDAVTAIAAGRGDALAGCG